MNKQQPFHQRVASYIFFTHFFFDNNTSNNDFAKCLNKYIFCATCLSGDTLALATSKALSDCLPGIIPEIQVQSQSVVSNTSHAVSSLFSLSSSTSFTQTSGHQQQQPAASTGNISVPCFVSTFCSYSNLIFGLPSLASSTCSQSMRTVSPCLFPSFLIRSCSSEETSSLAPASPLFPTNSWARLWAANLSNLQTFS